MGWTPNLFTFLTFAPPKPFCLSYVSTHPEPASLCSLAGRYDNPIPTRFLAPIDYLKIPALYVQYMYILKDNGRVVQVTRQAFFILSFFFNVGLVYVFSLFTALYEYTLTHTVPSYSATPTSSPLSRWDTHTQSHIPGIRGFFLDHNDESAPFYQQYTFCKWGEGYDKDCYSQSSQDTRLER